MKAYSKDLRERVIRASERGEAVLSIAQRLEVGFGWVYSLLRRYRATGSYEALPSNAGAKPKLSQSDLELLRQAVRERPDATLEELKNLTGFSVSIATICRTLKKLGLSFKKKRFMQASKIILMCKKRGKYGR
jgi:transposase